MTDFDEILGAFEQALELERELGVRTVDCDRALLVPMRPAPQPAPQSVAQPVASPQPASAATVSAPAPQQRPSLTPVPQAAAKPAGGAAVPSGVVDVSFIAERRPQGEAAQLLGKMILAMGYKKGEVTVVDAATAATVKPAARVYVVLGREAFKVFAPGQRASLGLWLTVADVPTVVTYSPERILSYFGSDVEGLTKAKRQIWSDLKSALARLGKKPPTVSR